MWIHTILKFLFIVHNTSIHKEASVLSALWFRDTLLMNIWYTPLMCTADICVQYVYMLECTSVYITQGGYNGHCAVGDFRRQMAGILNISHLRHSIRLPRHDRLVEGQGYYWCEVPAIVD